MSKRTHYCNEINRDTIGSRVVLCGWVNAIRDMGSIVWIDLRDSTGIVQIVSSKNNPPLHDSLYNQVKSLKKESVIQVEGVVQEKKSCNSSSLNIEVFVEKIVLFSTCKRLPIDMGSRNNLKEELALRYRYLDMRRMNLHKNLTIRNEITILTRSFLENERFIEVRTPHLIRPSYGGAKEFLVQTDSGEWFALAQGPQIHMELLMAGGFDRCYQFSHCICNEDSRHNRQIEFDQLHCEMAFMDEEDVFALFDKYLINLASNILGIYISDIPRISWNDSMRLYGKECPDIRQKENDFCPIWITDIPMFKFDDASKNYKIKHHPFTAIREENIDSLKEVDLSKVISRSYNLSINGVKVGGSSIRNYNRATQELLFLQSGLTQQELDGFECLLEAMDYGMPPHAGMSFGFDRLCAIFDASTNVKDYMFFPKSSSGRDLTTGAPIRQ